MEKQGEFRESLKETDWAYIAAFIDGEGYVGIKRDYKVNKKKKHNWSQEGWYCYTPRVSVHNTDKDVLDFICGAFDSPSKVCKRKMKDHNLRPIYSYEVCSRKVLKRVLPYFMPYMRIKKKAAELVYRLVCLPRGSGPEKENIYQEYYKLICNNGQKAIGDSIHKNKCCVVGNPEPSLGMKYAS